MYTVSKGPSKIVAKTRRGISQNYQTFGTIKDCTKKSDLNTPEENNIPRPVFQTTKKVTPAKLIEYDVITPQHEEIIRYINDSWNILVAQNPYDATSKSSSRAIKADANNNTSAVTPAHHVSSTTTTPCYWVEPPSPVLSDFKPFDLESWWGRRLYHNITKSL